MDNMDVTLSESSDSDSHISSISVTSDSPLLEDEEMTLLMEQWQAILNERVTNLEEQWEYLKAMLEHEKKEVLRKNVDQLFIAKRKKFQKLQAELKYDAEQMSIVQNYEEKKRNLYDNMKSNLEEQLRQEVQKSIHSETSVNDSSANNTTDIKTKPMLPNRTYCVNMISDEDLNNDWTTIKKALLDSNLRKMLCLPLPH